MKDIYPATPRRPVTSHHRVVLVASAEAKHGAYLGRYDRHWHFAPPEHSVMVLGPPRSGKTTSLIIPNVMAANGPVVSTSTKPDVLDATLAARSALGRAYVFDPTATVGRHHGTTPLRWSPLQSCTTWTTALSMSRSLVEVGPGGAGRRSSTADNSHWNERAQSLLAPLLYAAAMDGADMRTVLTWVDRRQGLPAQQILAGGHEHPTSLARNLLDGITATDERELSGIWSTASGALAGFRSEEALAATSHPTFDADAFVRSADTVYVAAPAHQQTMVAPMVVGLIDDVRRATYRRAAERDGAVRSGTMGSEPPVLLALDEVANIAPLPDLPSMISEGGGQGLVTLACLQDLSQARDRWPGRAEGFPSLFGTTVVLAGIGDVATLQGLSILAGEEEIPTRTVSAGRTLTDHPLTDLLSGGRPQYGESVSTQWRPRLPPDAIARGHIGHALAFDHRNQPSWVPLTPSHLDDPWRALRALDRGMDRGAERALGHQVDRGAADRGGDLGR